MAPPSELAWGVSKRATTDFANPSPWKVTCGIQAVAIEPPRVSAAKRVDTASIAPSRGSVALLSHRSRIIQARRSRGARLQLHQDAAVEVHADQELSGLEEGGQELLGEIDDVHTGVRLVGQHGFEIGQ